MPTRSCAICGLWGERGFRPAEAAEAREGFVCVNDRACKRRGVFVAVGGGCGGSGR